MDKRTKVNKKNLEMFFKEEVINFMFYGMKQRFIKKFVFTFFLLFQFLQIHGAEASEVIFIAEIPSYTPFRVKVSIDALLDKEKSFLSEGESSLEDKLSTVTYAIENPDKEKIKKGKSVQNSWRGKLRLYEDKPPSETAEILNFDKDREHISNTINLFEREAFGTNEEESRREVNDKLRLILLANRMESIFETKNQSLRYAHENRNALVLRGVWEPKWIKKVKKGAVFKNVPVKITEVRRYMRTCLLKAIDKKLPAGKRVKWKNKIKELSEEEQKVSGHVPYHELREYLRMSPERNVFVRRFIDAHPKARLYSATHDSDLIGLRLPPDSRSLKATLLSSTGLYTHYMASLRKFKEKHYSLPNVLTTGYRIAYEPERFKSPQEYAWIYQVIEEERYAKAEVSGIDFRATYISEPNCLYLVPKGKTAVPHSFLKLPNGDKITLGEYNRYDPCESMAIMCQMYAASRGVTLYFDPTHPVLMKIPERMLNYKKSKTHINVEDLGFYDLKTDKFTVESPEKIWKLPSSISQSPFAARDYAITLYRQLALGGKKFKFKKKQVSYPDNLFITLYSSIFNYYNFIPTQSAPARMYFGKYLERHKLDPHSPLIVRLGVINKLKTSRGQVSAMERFLNEIYGEGMGNIIIQVANKMTQARRDHYRAFFSLEDESVKSLSLKQKSVRSLRTFPKIFIERDAHIKPPKVVITKSERSRRSGIKEEVEDRGGGKLGRVQESLVTFFRQHYDRGLVTKLLTNIPLSTADIAKIIIRSPSTVYRLKYPGKYGAQKPSAQYVWNLFYNKSIAEISRILGTDTVTQLAKKLGYCEKKKVDDDSPSPKGGVSPKKSGVGAKKGSGDESDEEDDEEVLLGDDGRYIVPPDAYKEPTGVVKTFDIGPFLLDQLNTSGEGFDCAFFSTGYSRLQAANLLLDNEGDYIVRQHVGGADPCSLFAGG
jgi:hypothetical protein